MKNWLKSIVLASACAGVFLAAAGPAAAQDRRDRYERYDRYDRYYSYDPYDRRYRRSRERARLYDWDEVADRYEALAR
uniref:hypothetical protein n=1 Tax=uncultured Hyphomicrobium sp. TaxID=194373 RepID=UPI0025F926F3